MAEQSTDIHGPAASARSVTGLIAICSVCGVQWQVKGDSDKEGCNFCNADKTAISIKSETDR